MRNQGHRKDSIYGGGELFPTPRSMLQRCKGGWKFGNCDSKENANLKVLFCYERGGGYVGVQMGSAPTPPPLLLCIFPWAYRYLPFRSFFTQLNFAKFSKMSVHVNSAVFTMFFAFTVNSDKYACRLYKRKSPCPTNIYIQVRQI